MTGSEHPPDAPQPDPAAKPTPAELLRLAHLFRHWGADPADRFLFDLVSRYRGGDPL